MTRRGDPIPFVDLGRQIDDHRVQLDTAISRVVEQRDFVRGGSCTRFEEAFSRYLGVRYVLGVGSGTDALALSLAALRIGPRDELITAANTFPASAEAILMTGGRPVFADVDPDTLCLDPADVERAITPHTRAIVPVHLHGAVADMDALGALARAHGLALVEDAAQAHGATAGHARVGAIGLAGCFSFYPSKNLGAFGDGGAVATDDARLAEFVRQVRDHGRSDDGRHRMIGKCSRLDTLQAAVLLSKLPHLDRWNERRRAIAHRYLDGLAGCPGLRIPAQGDGGVYHHFVVRTTQRDALRVHLDDLDIGTAVHYPRTVPQEPAYARFRTRATPEADHSVLEVLSLPMFPELRFDEVDRVTDAVWEFFKARC